MSGPNDCSAGTYWYLEGRGTLVTWQPMTSGTLALEYDATFTTIGIGDADADDDIDIPADFEEMVLEYCLWKMHERHEESWRRARVHHSNFGEAVREARRFNNRAPHKRGYARGTEM